MLRYSIFTKFLIIVLCAVSLVACAAGAAGIVTAETNGLYTRTVEDWVNEELNFVGYSIAHDYCSLYATEQMGTCPEEVISTLRDGHFSQASRYDYAIELYQDGKLVNQGGNIPKDALTVTMDVYASVPTIVADEDLPSDDYNVDHIIIHDPSSNDYTLVNLEFSSGPRYQVKLYLQSDVLNPFRSDFMHMVYGMRYHFFAILVVGLLIFAVAFVFLCCVAGHNPRNNEIYPQALNRLPLDLYAAVIVAAEAGVSWIVIEMLDACFDYGGNWAVASLIGLGIFAMALMVVAYLFAFAAQVKTKGGFWWRRTITGFLLSRLRRGVRAIFRSLGAVFGAIPLIWQWVGILILMMTVPVGLFFFAMASRDDFWIFIWAFLFFSSLAADVVLAGWWIWYMGQIVRGVAMMRRGNLDHKIPTAHMKGRFRDFAVSLNSMADAARIAAERQLKSERMKTELITNVSHDIKTPLTSIINYVDLLKKPHDEMQGQQYLDVLDRQSQRLKKLIGDLMDMSKASTGNMAVELERMDAVEAVNQALGEFSDKLAAVGLEPLFRCPRDTVMIRADGRLLWRVLSNLLSNAVKYAMPGTRLYLDLMTVEGNAVLNLKNISRDQLNVDADELMERFVRGDASRNTEGSGLGLNIAKSLVELQKGQMHLMVDGDLFKVTLVLPLCEE